MALPLERVSPTTVNIALTLRTHVTLSPFDDGWVRISSQGYPESETCRTDELSFQPPFGLFLAAISHFGVHGVQVHISSQSPVRSALGGSSTALVALLKGLSKLASQLGRKPLSARELLHLAYHLEDAIAGGNCGLQDQGAAVYGGISKWEWHFGGAKTPYKRIPLLDRKGHEEFSDRLVVAYSGKRHISAEVNRRWITDFLEGRTREGWVRVNQVVRRFADAVSARSWGKAARLLREEMALRRELTPEALIPITDKLVTQAEGEGCGARFAGAGAGGCIWAVGSAKDTQRLRRRWEQTLSSVSDARILNCRVDSAGARQETGGVGLL
jgi:D-glycero-alpha-D-manno-heptose-7-phosphate kinase